MRRENAANLIEQIRTKQQLWIPKVRADARPQIIEKPAVTLGQCRVGVPSHLEQGGQRQALAVLVDFGLGQPHEIREVVGPSSGIGLNACLELANLLRHGVGRLRLERPICARVEVVNEDMADILGDGRELR